MSVNIRVNTSDVTKKFGILQGGILKAVLTEIGQAVLFTTRQSFDAHKSPEGASWAALSPRYARIKARLFPGKGILHRRETLSSKLFEHVEARSVAVGSTQPYAAIHQWGGVAGRRGPFKKKGGKRAQIPARPYLPAVRTAEQIALQAAEDVLAEQINKAGLK